MPPRLRPGVADLVSRELKRQDMTLRELGRQVGVSHSELSRWLNGRQSIRLKYAERVMAVLGIRVVPPEQD